MRKGDSINGYKILDDGTMNGMCSWTFAKKNGKEYFIKEFLYPTYPTADSPGSAKTKDKKKLECKIFETRQRELIQVIKSKVSLGGNLIFAVDFFREGTKYYKVTEKVDVASLNLSEISKLELKKQVLIMTTVAFSIKILHDLNIVHGDLKPDNILIKKIDSGVKKVDAGYTTKLIDFDSSFFAESPPESTEDLVGDIAYFSPELLKFIKRDAGVKAKDLTTKSDIFALGLIFSKYLTNNFPSFDKEKYKFISVASSHGEEIIIKADICPPELESLINSMLKADHNKRPEIKDIHQKLKALLHSPELSKWKPIIKAEPTPEIKSKLKISMGSKKESVSVEAKTSETEISRVKFGKGLKK